MAKKTPWEQFKANPNKYRKRLLKEVKVREVRPWDMLNPHTEYTSEEEAARRLAICKGCPLLIQATNQCKKCGCFMNLKTKLVRATCPVGHW